ncbi:C6 transcription factor [Colletotrichum incanum]|nr:C6 transcription factor [Colletotrichum incanum]
MAALHALPWPAYCVAHAISNVTGSDLSATDVPMPQQIVTTLHHAGADWIVPRWQRDASALRRQVTIHQSTTPVHSHGSAQGHGTQLASEELSHRLSSLDSIRLGSNNPAARVSSISQQPDNINSDLLVDAYYKFFHKFHPFLVPQGHFASLCQDPGRETSLKPLIAIMRLVGNVYIAQEWSVQLKEHVESCFSEANPACATMVQCRLLYSVALFWYNHKVEAKQQMDLAVRLALDLEIFQQEFARAHGAEDPVLIESWRRTRWELYIIDAYYAGTLGTLNFTVVDIDATVELPCEEWEYESGNIPQSKTLENFDCREFTFENTSFSSFTYLISAVRCAALAISTAPKASSREDSTHIIQNADSVIEGWSLLLPQDRKQVMTKAGEIDELLFQAHLLINRTTPESSKPELINVHTIRVLRSVEAQIRLLALPVRPFRHTPFVTCMTSEGTLALLSACTFLLKGKELAIARDQIRMTIGCLKTLGKIWPRTARNVQEIQTIARHVLRLEPKTTSISKPANFSSASSLPASETRLSSQTEPPAGENDVFSSFGSMDDVCGWYSLEDLGPHFAEWIGNRQ